MYPIRFFSSLIEEAIKNFAPCNFNDSMISSFFAVVEIGQNEQHLVFKMLENKKLDLLIDNYFKFYTYPKITGRICGQWSKLIAILSYFPT